MIWRALLAAAAPSVKVGLDFVAADQLFQLPIGVAHFGQKRVGLAADLVEIRPFRHFGDSRQGFFKAARPAEPTSSCSKLRRMLSTDSLSWAIRLRVDGT